MSTYAVIYEQASDGSWSARAADLPVYAVGDTRQEAEAEIRSAISFFLEDPARADDPAPAIGVVEVGIVTV